MLKHILRAQCNRLERIDCLVDSFSAENGNNSIIRKKEKNKSVLLFLSKNSCQIEDID